MSSDPSKVLPAESRFQCPACRAKQPLQDACRRCGADLQLLAQAQRRVAWLIQKRQTAIASANLDQAMKYERELRLLKPSENSRC